MQRNAKCTVKHMVNAIIFDFDGVVLESLNVKTNAFKKLYEPYGSDISKRVVEHHLENGGVSRFDKIKFYHNIFLGEEIDEKKRIEENIIKEK